MHIFCMVLAMPFVALFVYFVALFVYICFSLGDVGASIEKNAEIINGNDTIYFSSKVHGLTGDHIRIIVTDNNGNLNIESHSPVIYYKFQNDSLILYTHINDMDSSSHYNRQSKIRLVDLKDYDDISNMEVNYSKVGLKKFSVYND